MSVRNLSGNPFRGCPIAICPPEGSFPPSIR